MREVVPFAGLGTAVAGREAGEKKEEGIRKNSLLGTLIDDEIDPRSKPRWRRRWRCGGCWVFFSLRFLRCRLDDVISYNEL